MPSVLSKFKITRTIGSIVKKLIGFTKRRGSPVKRIAEKDTGEHRSPEKSAPKRTTGITPRQIITALSLTLFERPGRALASTFELERVFDRAGLNIHPIKYSAETIMWTILSAVVSIVITIIIAFSFKPSLLSLLILVLLTIMIPILVFTIRLGYPYMKASERRNSIENELPFFMAYVSTMVKGGSNLEMIIERIAQLKVFRAVREECRRILTRMRVFGEDPITAIDKVVLNHPSSKFRDILLGYTTTLRSGGDVSHYLEVRTREVFESRMNEIKVIAGRILSLLEVYMVLGVVISLTVYVFTVTSSVITAAQAGMRPGGAMNINVDISMLFLYNYIALPLTGLFIALAIHTFQPKSNIGYEEVYATLLLSMPLSIIVFLLVLAITGGTGIFVGRVGIAEVRSLIYSLSLSLITLSAFPALTYLRITRKQKGIIRAVASFLRDVSEIRKTGLSPEKCIILVSNRDYRSLKPVVEKTAVSLMLGLNLEEALRRSLRGVKDWFTVTIMKFLIDSILVGGGSPDVIDTLARFTQALSELDEETKRRVRPQIILPYVGTVLLAMGPIVLLYMLLALARIPIVYMTPLVLTLAVGCFLNSYLMGLVAGKAISSTMAAGFLHTIPLTIVTTVALNISLAYTTA